MTSLEKSAKEVLLILGYEDDDEYWGHDTSFSKSDVDKQVKEWSKKCIKELEQHMKEWTLEIAAGDKMISQNISFCVDEVLRFLRDENSK